MGAQSSRRSDYEQRPLTLSKLRQFVDVRNGGLRYVKEIHCISGQGIDHIDQFDDDDFHYPETVILTGLARVRRPNGKFVNDSQWLFGKSRKKPGDDIQLGVMTRDNVTGEWMPGFWQVCDSYINGSPIITSGGCGPSVMIFVRTRSA